MNITEKAKAIRKQLKDELNYTTKQVSVKKASYCSIWVTVKEDGLDVEAIKKIAFAYKHIHWDENGEILAGGNDYVFVKNAYGRSL